MNWKLWDITLNQNLQRKKCFSEWCFLTSSWFWWEGNFTWLQVCLWKLYNPTYIQGMFVFVVISLNILCVFLNNWTLTQCAGILLSLRQVTLCNLRYKSQRERAPEHLKLTRLINRNKNEKYHLCLLKSKHAICM